MRKLFRGSALVYTLIMMMLLLVSGLALVTTTLVQQRGASGSGDSLRAFQAANDGFEDLIARAKLDPSKTLGYLGTTCDVVDGVATVGRTVGGNHYDATFTKEDTTTGNLVPVADCNVTTLSSVSEVKVVAQVGASTRAIETAFAAGGGGVTGGCTIIVKPLGGSTSNIVAQTNWGNGCKSSSNVSDSAFRTGGGACGSISDSTHMCGLSGVAIYSDAGPAFAANGSSDNAGYCICMNK